MNNFAAPTSHRNHHRAAGHQTVVASLLRLTVVQLAIVQSAGQWSLSRPVPPRCICSRMPLALQHVNPRSSFCTSLEVTRDASAHASELVSHSAMHDYVHHKRSKLKGTRCIHVKMTFDYFCRRDFPAEPLRPRQAAATSTQPQLTRPCTDYSSLLLLQRRSRPTRPDDTGGCC